MNTSALGGIICISLGVDILPSTETLNFLFERHKLISLIKLVKNFNFDNVYYKPGCQEVSKAF
jgi:hypothetical protein